MGAERDHGERGEHGDEPPQPKRDVESDETLHDHLAGERTPEAISENRKIPAAAAPRRGVILTRPAMLSAITTSRFEYRNTKRRSSSLRTGTRACVKPECR